jgi:outer membrane lipoprotein-sorting protein
MKRLFASVCFLVIAWPAWAADWDLDQLMQALARNTVSRATFIEKKYFAILDEPIISSGELLFSAPDRLERRTIKPRAETVVLESGTLTMSRGQRQTILKVQDHPALGAFTESIRATLAGDRQALERHYNLTLNGTEARWSLLLIPRAASTRAYVLEIRMDGVRGDVLSMQTESGRDRSIMTIQKTAGL